MNVVTGAPNAKINLGLRVLRKRPDGYHDIESVLLPVGLHDRLEIELYSGNEDHLQMSGIPVMGKPEDNLVLRAVRLQRSIKYFPTVTIRLQKMIPAGAGLGGGSSDAATTLLMLNDLFGLGFTQSELARMAAQIGSDCPFFVYNKPMLATGRGTDLTPVEVPLSDYWVVIVKPNVHISTPWAYRQVTPSAVPEFPDLKNLSVSQWRNYLVNDFQKPVVSSYPVIGELLRKLELMGAEYYSLSGSGSAVYGLFSTKPQNCESVFQKYFFWYGPVSGG